ncbi:hypothetical protein [Hymenobacter crusticola]|uniref:Uncharacterized protein n=1 Tax=Hymenobacter crusticola TaxID=1770526 RepID=A0A243W9Y0_9BACT|nr:hypothetical protein [Hymenobacter crusticola]OUJ72356.1 hypothetical protein BXP70_19075 [Hymenobacter crusticola]
MQLIIGTAQVIIKTLLIMPLSIATGTLGAPRTVRSAATLVLEFSPSLPITVAAERVLQQEVKLRKCLVE